MNTCDLKQLHQTCKKRKGKIEILPNSKENSEPKVRYRMAKWNAPTHQTNGKQLISWIKSVFIAYLTSYWYDSA